MEKADFDELAGRIDGLGRAVMHMAVMLERVAIIDGPCYSATLQAEADRLHVDQPGLHAAKTTLLEIRRALDEWRTRRQ